MISYVDQYVADSIDSLLKGMLNNSYIIKEEVLKELPDDVLTPFINTYSIDKGKGINIPVTFSFPNNSNSDTYILIQYKGSQEVPEDSSIGSYQGNSSYNTEGSVYSEKIKLNIDNDNKKVSATLSNKPYEVYSVKEINNFNYSKGNKEITFPYYSFYEGKENFYIHVTYSMYNDEVNEEHLVKSLGINTVEGVTIDIVSTNINTLRCLFGIINSICIYMKNSIATNYNVSMPQVTVMGDDLLDDITSPTNSTIGQKFFSRRFEITYKVTQTITPKDGEGPSHIDLNIN